MSTSHMDGSDVGNLADLSAWFDGEGRFPERLLQASADDSLRAGAMATVESWQSVSLASRTLDAGAGVHAHGAYWARLSGALAKQPAPTGEAPLLIDEGVSPPSDVMVKRPAANDERGWLWGVAASLVVVGVLGALIKPWQWRHVGKDGGHLASATRAGEVPISGSARATGLDPAIWMAHHHPMAGSPFQATAGFVRNVTYEAVSR